MAYGYDNFFQGGSGSGFGPYSFGDPYTNSPGSGQPVPGGAGAYNLPQAFDYWDAASRYAVPVAQGFLQETQPTADFFKGELGKDYSGILFNQARNQIDTGDRETGRMRTQAMTRSGLSGNAVSPLAMMQLEQEQMARSGALGRASQMAVMQAQQMKSMAARGVHDIAASRMQALLAPARFQSAHGTETPMGYAGPSPWAQGFAGLGAVGGAV